MFLENKLICKVLNEKIDVASVTAHLLVYSMCAPLYAQRVGLAYHNDCCFNQTDFLQVQWEMKP